MKLPKLTAGIACKVTVAKQEALPLKLNSLQLSGFGGNPCDDCIDRCLDELGGSPDLCRFSVCRRECGVN
jgi:hypothetical protein